MKTFLAVFFLLVLFIPDHFTNGETYWTGWLNRDNPKIFGDFESYKGFRHPPCAPDYSPIDAECRVNKTKKAWYTTNIKFVENHECSIRGLACRNKDQEKYEEGKIFCPDFEVRFLCHRPEFFEMTGIAPEEVTTTASP